MQTRALQRRFPVLCFLHATGPDSKARPRPRRSDPPWISSLQRVWYSEQLWSRPARRTSLTCWQKPVAIVSIDAVRAKFTGSPVPEARFYRAREAPAGSQPYLAEPDL